MVTALPLVLVVDDDPAVAAMHAGIVRDLGYDVDVLHDPRQVIPRLARSPAPGLVLLDLNMPGMSGLDVLREIKLRHPAIGVVMATVVNDIEPAVQATKSGAWNYLLKPLQQARVAPVLEAWLAERAAIAAPDADFAGFVTRCDAFVEIFRRVRSFAPTDVCVLISGETGTGKELIAERIHALSAVRDGPFVAVNLAALSPSLFESELFGHRQGAFTGATHDHPGYLAAAAHGTLFLDEIGELAPDQQKRLLRVLQSRTYQRVGETAEREVAARIVVATNRDLRVEVSAGRFRDDLYYRLASHAIMLPPLRERPGDIAVLARHFVRKYASQFGRRVDDLDPESLRLLQAHAFPGNVRELEGMISGAVLIERTATIRPESLPDWLRSSPVAAGSGQDLASVRYQTVMKTLADCGGNQTRAAERLGISRVTLNRWLKAYRDRNESA